MTLNNLSRVSNSAAIDIELLEIAGCVHAHCARLRCKLLEPAIGHMIDIGNFAAVHSQVLATSALIGRR